MSGDDLQQRAEDSIAALGRALAAGDLRGVAALAVQAPSGQALTWARGAADMLRLLAELVSGLVEDPSPADLRESLRALADHEVDELAAALARLHQEAGAEAARRGGAAYVPRRA